jgi:DNA-binding beta-propeller fold protein YncE
MRRTIMKTAIRWAAAALAIGALLPVPGLAAQQACTPIPAFDDRCEAWAALHGTVASGGEQARGMAIGGDRIFTTGLRNTGGFQYDYLTVGYELATGAEKWTAQYDGPLSDLDIPWGAAATPNGSRVFVTGESMGSNQTGSDVATVAYDGATGAELWVARFDRGSVDTAKAIALSPDGSTVFVLADISSNTDPDHGLGVIAYDAGDGAELWVSELEGKGYVWPAGIAVDASGNRVFVGGWTGGTDPDKPLDTDYLLGAFRAKAEGGAPAGEVLWRTTFNGGQDDSQDRLTGLAISPDGSRVFATGYVDRTETSVFAQYQMATVAFDGATGTKIWDKVYTALGSSQGAAITVSPDGSRVYVSGKTTGSPTGDGLQTTFAFVILAYDAGQGAQLWPASYDHPGTTDHPTAMALSPDGNRLYVTGWSGVYAAPENNMHVATVAYNAIEGTRLWVARYNSSDTDADGGRPWTMAATGDRVFVAGGTKRTSSSALLGNYDYLTLAYAA